MTDTVDQTKTIIDDSEVVNVPDQAKEELSNLDPAITMLAEIKREDGSQKYSGVTSALKALKDSQEFIGTLQSENKSLKDKLDLYKEKAERTIAMEELLNELKTGSKEPEKPSTEPTKQVDLESMVNSLLEKRESTRTIQANQKAVADKLVTKFGDKTKAAEFYKSKATELGIGVNFLNDLCGHSPEAAIKVLGLDTEVKPVGIEDVKQSTSVERWKPANPNKKPVSVMSGGSTRDMMEAWNRAKQPNTN